MHVTGEKRDTTAARLMQRFAERPYSTWKTIELSLAPYRTRLRTLRAGFLYGMEKRLDDVMIKFSGNDLTRDAQLSGEFLLAYHCQRKALQPSDGDSSEDESNDTND